MCLRQHALRCSCARFVWKGFRGKAKGRKHTTTVPWCMDPLGRKHLYNEVTREIFINPWKLSSEWVWVQTEILAQRPCWRWIRPMLGRMFKNLTAVSPGATSIAVFPNTHTCTHTCAHTAFVSVVNTPAASRTQCLLLFQPKQGRRNSSLSLVGWSAGLLLCHWISPS